MMKFYVISTGEYEDNLNKTFIGQSNVPLNEQGIEQAEEIAEELKNDDFSAVYSAPSQCAKETADIFVMYHDLDILPRSNIENIDVGEAFGHSCNSYKYDRCKLSVFTNYPNGESYADVIVRVYEFLNERIQEYKDTVKIVIITYEDICRVIHTYFNNLKYEEFLQDTWDYCELRVYDTEKMREE